MKTKNLTILGSTGSIGINTLDVLNKNLNIFSIYALISYGNNIDLMTLQCLKYQPKYACTIDVKSAKLLKKNLLFHECKTSVLSGLKSACQLSSSEDIDTVVAATLGLSGIPSIFAAIKSGKKILLANKEILVTCGNFFMQKIKKYNAFLCPIDSEHNAIFQTLSGNMQKQLGNPSLLSTCQISSIILTGSGGPFRNIPLKDLHLMTPDQACAHPNWKMGRKISVDSATMMNKGLEYIVARLLFQANSNQIEVLLHPQSVIHAMIRYIDGSIFSHMSVPDIKTAISYGLGYPKRIFSGNSQVNFLKINHLSFESINEQRYPCFYLALQAMQSGQGEIITLNAANEIVVEAFLSKKIKFTDIAIINRNILETFKIFSPKNIKDILMLDKKVRKYTSKYIKLKNF
ncbi:MAG: 1-deoxy-D-xylulose 5-phosphate reductoisomerase [Wigglesworthia glossinidia]|nr:1-deoxy-D-xylulose 5-phosphate reductoisomerase [Wigglesworthia glossinidia]